jgi:hypothetical protein
MKTIAIELKWGLGFVVMMLAWMVFEKVGGFHDERIEQHMTVTNFVSIPAILIYVYALKDKKANFYNGQMSYIQSFVSGAIITGVVTVLSPGLQYVISTFITPDFFKNMIEYTVNQGQMTREEAEANFNLNSYIFQSTVGSAAMGLVTTAIVSIFTKTKTPKQG